MPRWVATNDGSDEPQWGGSLGALVFGAKSMGDQNGQTVGLRLICDYEELLGRVFEETEGQHDMPGVVDQQRLKGLVTGMQRSYARQAEPFP